MSLHSPTLPHRLRAGTVFLLLAVAASSAVADWTGVHRDTSHNAVEPVATQVGDLTVAPSWDTGDADLVTGARIAQFENVFFAVSDDGSEVRVGRFRALDGTFLDESDPLAARIFGSTGGLALDAADRSLYYLSGSEVQKLDADTLALDWSTTIDATNTTPAGAGYSFVNSTATFGVGRVFVCTYDMSFTAAQSQIVALDAATGAVDWFDLSGGFGSYAPLFVDLGASQRVLVPGSTGGGSTGSAFVNAYDAATGTLVWTSRAGEPESIAVPWTLQRQVWTEMVLAGGAVYAGTYDFTPSNTELARFDPATGTLAWQVPALSSDGPLVVVGGRALVYGGPFSASRFAGYDIATGSEDFNVAIGGTTFRTFMAATNDSVYVIVDGDILRLDPATGATLSASTTTLYAGVPIVDALGGVFTPTAATGMAGFGLTVPVGLSAFALE